MGRHWDLNHVRLSGKFYRDTEMENPERFRGGSRVNGSIVSPILKILPLLNSDDATDEITLLTNEANLIRDTAEFKDKQNTRTALS